MSNQKWDLRFLDLAKLVSTWSKDPSTKVGAAIVRPDKSVASVGFNGFPQCMPDNPEWYADREQKYSRIVHGEKNAMIFANAPIRGFTLYTYPFMPCDRCAVEMQQAGIIRMVAPVASADAETRWGKYFELTRKYCLDSKIELVELQGV